MNDLNAGKISCQPGGLSPDCIGVPSHRRLFQFGADLGDGMKAVSAAPYHAVAQASHHIQTTLFERLAQCRYIFPPIFKEGWNERSQFGIDPDYNFLRLPVRIRSHDPTSHLHRPAPGISLGETARPGHKVFSFMPRALNANAAADPYA